VVNWLLWWSLLRAGEAGRAERIRRTALDQISSDGFAEYFEPFTGEPLGSNSQSWTAAVILDWLLSDVGDRGPSLVGISEQDKYLQDSSID
jgi:hypothetical protein